MSSALVFLGQAIPSFLGVFGLYLVLLFIQNGAEISFDDKTLIYILVFSSIVWMSSGIKLISFMNKTLLFDMKNKFRFLILYLFSGIGLNYLLKVFFIQENHFLLLNIFTGLILGFTLFVIDFKYVYKVI